MGELPWYVTPSHMRVFTKPITMITGQDNPSDQCIVGDVPTIFNGDESDHDGPYNGVEMGC